MNLLGLALRNIEGSAFRSGAVFLCVLMASGLSLTVTLIARGTERSTQLGIQRLGADILVVPEGVESKVQTALLMGKPVTTWMPAANYQKVASVPGVAAASPQIFLTSLSNASCCAVSELFLVAIDPETDFTIRPWLERVLGKPLAIGESIGGYYVFVPEGDNYIKLYGYFLTLKGNLEPTGTGIDQTLFLNMDTAREMARISLSRAESPLDIPSDSISAVMVKVGEGQDAGTVARRIDHAVAGVATILSPDLFGSFRDELDSLLRGVSAILAILWVLSAAVVGLVFSMAINERRRQIAILRALGATGEFVFRSLLAEAALLALGGAITGIALASAGTYLFTSLIGSALGVPYLSPPASQFLALLGGTLLAALTVVALAALGPALRVSRQEPAVAMRE